MFGKMDYVYAVYKENSFTQAAEKLFISQPCLSAAIKKTENQLGAPLFERRYSGLKLTQIGEMYIAAAEKIMEVKREFEEKINNINNLECGSITIGGPNYVSSHIMPKIVSEFSKRHPKIDIFLTEANSVELEKKIQSGEIDIFIDSFDEENAECDSYALKKEKILLAVPSEFKANKGLEKYRITPEEIFCGKVDLDKKPALPCEKFKKEKFVLLKSGNNMHKHSGAVFKKAGFTPEISFQMDQLLTSYALCASGNGACFVTDTMFKYHNFKDNVFLYNIEGTGERTMFLFKNKSRYTTLAMSKFIEVAKSFFD